jgi:hypothetical protein
MRLLLVHVLARVAGQLLADLEWNIGIGHRRIEAVSDRLRARLVTCWSSDGSACRPQAGEAEDRLRSRLSGAGCASRVLN